MSPRALAISATVVVALVVVGMLFGLSFERAAFLAPVLVFAAGGVAFLVVLWVKVVRDSLRGRG